MVQEVGGSIPLGHPTNATPGVARLDDGSTVPGVAGYDAFISYSHADGALAPAVQKGLEQLARPWNRRRALHVFRDGTDLTASPHLWGSIVEAMDASRWFVLICSPAATRSEWVPKEIEHWLARPDGGPERMLLVIAAGTCEWDDGGFTAATDCVPDVARTAITDEPTYIDLTILPTPQPTAAPGADGGTPVAPAAGHLDLKQPAFQEAIAKIAAPIHGPEVKPADLIGEDLRQFKLAKRYRRGALIALTVLTVAAVIASVIAFAQQRRARSNAAQARARELAATAQTTMTDDPALGALLALEAVYPDGATSPSGPPDAREVLGIALRNLQWAAATRAAPDVNRPVGFIAWSDRHRIATVDGKNCCDHLDWWDRATGRPTHPAFAGHRQRDLLARYGSIHDTSGAVSTEPATVLDGTVRDPFTYTADGTLVGRLGSTNDFVVVGPDGATRRRLTLPGPAPAAVVALASGRIVALDRDGGLHQWAPGAGEVATPIAYTPDPYSTTTTTGPRVRSIAVGGPDSVLVDSTAGGPTPGDAPCSYVCRDTTEVTSDTLQGYVGSSFADPTLALLDLSGPPPAFPPTVAEPAVTVAGSYAVAPAAHGHRLVAARTIATDASATADVPVWDLATMRRVATIHALAPTDVHWIDSTTLAIASARGLRQMTIHVPDSVSEPVGAVTLSADGRVRASVPFSSTGPVRVAPDRWGRPTVGAATNPETYAAGGGSGAITLDPHGELAATVVHRPVPPGSGCVTAGPACAPPTSVQVYRLGARRPIHTFTGARTAAFAPSGGRIAVAYRDRIDLVPVHGTRFGRPRPVRVPGFMPAAAVWAGKGPDLVLTGQGATHWQVRVVEPTVRRSHTLAAPAACPVGSGCGALATSADGRRLATAAADGAVTVWIRSGRTFVPTATFVAAAAEPTGLALDRDGSRLITSNSDATTAWDLGRPTDPRAVETISTLPALSHRRVQQVTPSLQDPPTPWGLVAFAPDGRTITLAGGGGVVTLADFDPRLVCALVTADDLHHADRVLGGRSACERVAALHRPAGPSERRTAADR